MIVGILGVGAAYVIQVGAAQSGSHLAVPADAKTAIVDAFRTYRLVGLGDDHGNMSVSDFRLSLLRDSRLATVVNDVVVEFGSSRYQDLIDRFILGESVPDIELRQVWENTTVPNGVWERPIYTDVFRVIRAVNAQLPKTCQLRVLLADPPIDWSEIETAEQVRNWNIQRGAFAADLIQREVIAKNRRALAIFGDGHFQARTERPPRGMVARLSLLGVELLAIASNSGPISKLQPDAAGWPTPSIAFVRNTPIGAAGYDLFYGPLPPGDYWAANRKFEDLLRRRALFRAGANPALAPDIPPLYRLGVRGHADCSHGGRGYAHAARSTDGSRADQTSLPSIVMTRR